MTCSFPTLRREILTKKIKKTQREKSRARVLNTCIKNLRIPDDDGLRWDLQYKETSLTDPAVVVRIPSSDRSTSITKIHFFFFSVLLFVVLLLPPSTDSFTLKMAIRHGTLFLFFSSGDPIAPLFLCLVLFRLERGSTAYYLWKRKCRNCPTILSEWRECPRDHSASAAAWEWESQQLHGPRPQVHAISSVGGARTKEFETIIHNHNGMLILINTT